MGELKNADRVLVRKSEQKGDYSGKDGMPILRCILKK
jgi:hypothetical protein